MSEKSSTRRATTDGKNKRRLKKLTPRSFNPAAMVCAALAQLIEVTENGAKRKITVFEAIVRQLAIKASQGQRRAFRALMQYQLFAIRRGNVRGVNFLYGDDLKTEEQMIAEYGDWRQP